MLSIIVGVGDVEIGWVKETTVIAAEEVVLTGVIVGPLPGWLCIQHDSLLVLHAGRGQRVGAAVVLSVGVHVSLLVGRNTYEYGGPTDHLKNREG